MKNIFSTFNLSQTIVSLDGHSFVRSLRGAAMLLMLVTMSIGQVWGDVTWNFANTTGSDRSLSGTVQFEPTSGTAKISYVAGSSDKIAKGTSYLSMGGATSLSSGALNQRYFTFKAPSSSGKVVVTYASSNAANAEICVGTGGSHVVGFITGTTSSACESSVISGLTAGTTDLYVAFPSAKAYISSIQWVDADPSDGDLSDCYESVYKTTMESGAALSVSSASVQSTSFLGYSNYVKTSSSSGYATVTFSTAKTLVAKNGNKGRIRIYYAHTSAGKGFTLSVNNSNVGTFTATRQNTEYIAEYIIPTGTTNISTIKATGSGSSGLCLLKIEVCTYGESCSAPGKPTISGGYHYFPGETIALTASATGTSGSTTYAWKKNGSAVAGQTTANLNIASCTAANAGKYTVVASNGGGCESASSDEFGVKILQSYLKDNSGTDLYNAPLTKVDATHARISFELSGNTTYRFNITDGCNNWYGNDGTMNKDNCSNWAFTSSNDCRITTTKAGVYVVTVDYSNLARPVVSVEYPSSNQAADKTIYFDNSDRNWNESKIYYRIGKSAHNSKQQMAKVPGTANLFKVVTNGYDGFEAWHIANNGCWSDGNSIYKTNTGDSWAATEAIKFIGNAVTSTITVVPTSEHVRGSDGNNNNCEFYSYQMVDGMKSHTATITAPSNGTITVAYKDVDNTEKNFTSGNRDLAHTCILTITATPATGYSLSGMTVNSGAFTSGNTHILSADATIAATFAAKTTSITINANTANHGSTAPPAITATYGQSLPAFTAAAGVSGYQLKGYYTAATAGTKVINADGTLVASVSGYTNGSSKWIKEDANVTLYAQYEAAAPVGSDALYDYANQADGGVTGGYKAFNDDDVTANGTNKSKSFTKDGCTLSITNGAYDKKDNLINAFIKLVSGTTTATLTIPVGKTADVTIKYGSYNTSRVLTVNTSDQTAPKAAMADGSITTSNLYTTYFTTVELTDQSGTLNLAAKGGNIYIAYVDVDVKDAAPADAWSMYTATSTKVGDFTKIDANTFKLEGFELSNSTRYNICFKNNSTQYYVNSNNCDITTKSALVEANNTFNFNTASDGTYDITITKEDGTWYVQAAAAAPTTYTITYNKGANGTGTIANGQKTAGVDFTLSSSTFTRDGYTQTGWATTDGGAKAYDLGGTYTTDADLTLYPFWTEDTLGGECELFSFVMKNDVANVSLTKKGGANDHLTLTATHAAISGGSVEIWNIDGSDSKMQIANSEIMFNGGNAYTKITLIGDVQLQAGDVLTFTTGQTARDLWFTTGATRPGSAPSTKCTASTSYTVKENDALDGQSTFYIWRNSSSTYFKSLTITRPGCGSKHTITFDKNDGSSTTATQTGVEDDTATPLKAIATIGWTRTGYTFAGWAEAADGAKVYDDGDNITITDNKTLYAKWTKNQYTITLDNQSATTAGDASVNVTYGSSVPASINVPAKTNNIFGGYYTETAGGGTKVIDADGHFVLDNEYVKNDGNWKYAGVLTLYAKWTSTVTTYTVTYDANGGTGTMTAAREYVAGETVTIKTNAFTAPSGKEFNGWVVTNNNTSATITVTAGKFEMPAAAVTITAQWKDKEVSGDCQTMVIFDGVDGTLNLSGTEPTSSATWSTTGNSNSPANVGSYNNTYSGKTYTKYINIFTSSSSSSTRYVEVVVPEGYTATFRLAGSTNSNGKARSIFVSKSKTGTLDQSIAYITSSTYDVVGATSAAMDAGTYYLCCDNSIRLMEFTVEICSEATGCKAPTISSASATPAAVCAGEEVTLSATATPNNAGSLTYTWFNSDNIEMGTGASVTVNPEENTTYYCVVAEEGCDKTAKSSTVSVSINAATAITTQPTSTNVGVGEEASLTVVATGSHLSYQWQQCATVDGEYTNVSALVTSSKSAKLLITPSATGTVYYRCVVSGDCGDVTSSAVSIEAGAATPTVTWGAAETVYQGQKISVSVTTNTDADFDEDALEISGDVANVVKTKNGKTITATMTVNTNADGTIDLTFNTTAGTSYGATVNAQKSITISGECPAGLSGVVYTATMATNETANATGGAVTVNNKLSSGSTATRGSNKYYKMDSSSKLTFTPEGGFKAGDVLTIDVTSSGSNDDGVIIKNAGGTQLADLHEKLSSSKNTLLTYTFTTATNYITLVRHSSNCYFYGATVTRAGSPTELAWNDGETSDGETVNVAPDAANFTIAAVSSNSPGAISYSSSNTSVATVNATTGEVDPKAVGKTTITATIVTNGCYTTKSITYILNVAADCTPPTITTQPKSAEYTVGGAVTALTVAASAGTYQWYINGSNNNTSGSPIGGATSASYIPTITEKGTTYYYCVVTDGYCSAVSNVATITVNPAPCALEAPKVIEYSKTGEGSCWTSITLKAVAQNDADLVGGSYQWYDDGEPIVSGGTSATLTVTTPGVYYVEYIKDACAQESSNKAYIESKEPQVEQLAPFQYYHAGKDDYSDQMNERHLFTHKPIGGDPTFSATLNSAAYAWSNLENAISIVNGENNVDTVMLSLNDLASCGLVAGDVVAITITPMTACGAPAPGYSATIDIKVVDSKPTLAFIVSGADEAEGTKDKANLDMNGDFLTGYNKADLKVQDGKTSVTAAELPLYTALKENYNVVPVNGYAPFSKWNYEPFDLVFLTDFVKTSRGKQNADPEAKEKVNELANIVDFRPFFTTKTHMSGIENWEKVGFTANPQTPKTTQKWMNIICYAHPMFENYLSNPDVVKEDQGDGNTEVVFTMLSQGGFDASKGIQGFRLADAANFVNISTCHYNAEASIDPVEKTCSPTNIGTDDELLVASCERQENIEARLLLLSVNADAMSFLTAEGIDVIILSLNYLLETNPLNVSDCSITFEGTIDTDWNKPRNWNNGKIPTAKNNVRIAAECHVNNGINAVAGSVKILKDKAGENGSLVIEPTGALTIAGSINRVERGAYLTLLPTHVEDVQIRSNASGNGALIHVDEKGNTKATVQMYSIANGAQGTNDDAPNWQWITTPFSDCSRAASNYYGTWLTEWNNSTHLWSPVIHNEDPVRPWYAYCHTRQTEGTLTMTGTLVPTTDQTFSFAHDAVGTKGTLSMVGNSWTAPIIISQFKDADFVNVEKKVTLWNTGFDPEGDNTEYVYGDGDGSAADHREQGTYVTIPIKVTQELKPALRVIPSMQAFEVKTTGSGAKLRLNYDQLVRPASGNVNIQPMRAPSRSAASQEGAEGITDRLYMVVKGSRYYDYAYVFENVACSDAYDDGWDGEKNWNSNYDIPQLFVENAAGEWTISTQDALVGTRFGFFRGEDLSYTITFRYEGSGLYLHDTKTDQYTEVRTGNSYTFQSQSFDNEHRFRLTDHNPYEVPTEIDDVSSGGLDVEKMILDDKIFIRVNNMLFDAVGRRVR